MSTLKEWKFKMNNSIIPAFFSLKIFKMSPPYLPAWYFWFYNSGLIKLKSKAELGRSL